MSYLQPLLPLVLILLLLIALVEFRSTRRLSSFIGITILILVSWPPVAWLALRPFESLYPMHPPDPGGAQAIVVLSSSVFPPFPPRPTPILGEDTYERCRYAAWLHHHVLPAPVLASGGGSRSGVPYAVTMSQALREEGVPADLVWTEQESRSTYENAFNSARLLKQKGIHKIILVTEAYHMRRSEACFRHQGVDVVPAACGFRIFSNTAIQSYIPTWEAIAWNEDTLHEAIGLCWYKLRGRI